MCDCNHSLVGIISLGPAGDFDFAKSADEIDRFTRNNAKGIKWQNHTSGRLLDKAGEVSGVSVQRHMLWHEGKVYMAGANMVSPAIYDAANGKCLNTITNLWETKAPRGSELFLADGQVRAVDSMMYAPREYIPSRYHAKYLLQAAAGNRVIQGTQNEIMCLELGAGENAKPKQL